MSVRQASIRVKLEKLKKQLLPPYDSLSYKDKFTKGRYRKYITINIPPPDRDPEIERSRFHLDTIKKYLEFHSPPYEQYPDMTDQQYRTFIVKLPPRNRDMVIKNIIFDEAMIQSEIDNNNIRVFEEMNELRRQLDLEPQEAIWEFVEDTGSHIAGLIDGMLSGLFPSWLLPTLAIGGLGILALFVYNSTKDTSGGKGTKIVIGLKGRDDEDKGGDNGLKNGNDD